MCLSSIISDKHLNRVGDLKFPLGQGSSGDFTLFHTQLKVPLTNHHLLRVMVLTHIGKLHQDHQLLWKWLLQKSVIFLSVVCCFYQFTHLTSVLLEANRDFPLLLSKFKIKYCTERHCCQCVVDWQDSQSKDVAKSMKDCHDKDYFMFPVPKMQLKGNWVSIW